MGVAAADELVTRAFVASSKGRFQEAVDLLRQALVIDNSLDKGHRAYLAEVLKSGGDLQNISRLAPARLNTLVNCGWVNSVLNGRPVNAQGQPIPWFTYPAIDFLEPKIKPHWTVLEWGCGNSTLWWAPRVKSVLSVEHDPAWLKIVATEAPANVTLALVEDPEKYVTLEGLNTIGSFDAIVIDGENRNRCARIAAERAKPEGIIVFENSDRKSVRDGMAFLIASGWKHIDFFGLLPSYLYRTCTSIFYRNELLLTGGILACDSHSSLGLSCAQVLGE